VPTLLVAASSCDLEKFYTLLDHVPWYDKSCTTSLRHRGIGRVSSLSDLRTACRDTHDLHGPFDTEVLNINDKKKFPTSLMIILLQDI
jgi:hypothetical protein